jgi:hypothetical protein
LDFLLHVLNGVAVWKEEKGCARGRPVGRGETRKNQQKEEKNTRSPRFHVERDGFARQGLDEDLHARHACLVSFGDSLRRARGQNTSRARER